MSEPTQPYPQQPGPNGHYQPSWDQTRQYPAFYQQNPVQPKKNTGGTAAIITGLAVAGLLVLGGGAFAAVTLVNSLSDKDIARAVPEDSSLFFQIDMDPSTTQKASALVLASKIDTLMDTKGEIDVTGKQLGEIITDPVFEELDYDKEVKPWLGDKAAVAAWGDFGDSYEYGYPKNYNDDKGYSSDPFDDYYDDAYLDGEYNESSQGVSQPNVAVGVSHQVPAAVAPPVPNRDKGNPTAVVVYEIKDSKKAEDAVKKIIDRKSDIQAYTIQGKYLVLAESKAGIDDYVRSMDKGSLRENPLYVSDMKSLSGDNIASGWVNLADLGLTKYLDRSGLSNNGINAKIDGRLATGISLNPSGVTSNTRLIGSSPDNAIIEAYKNAEPGVTDIENLPAETDIAVSAADLSGLASVIYEEMKASNPREIESIESSLESLDLQAPDDFDKVLGIQTSFGYTAKKDGAKPSYQYRAVDADASTLERILGKSGNASSVQVRQDGDTVVVSENGKPTGKLSDNPDFRKSLNGLDDAGMAMFIDMDDLNRSGSNSDKDYGVVGATSKYDTADDALDFTVRWIY